MSGLPIARIAGIEVRVSLAWVFLLAIVTVLAAETAARFEPGLSSAVGWAIGGAVAAAFLLTVLAHELTHTLVARRQGLPADTVVIGFIGGTSPFDLEGRTAREEIAIAISGPLVSLGIAGVVLGFGVALDDAGGVVGAAGGGLLVIGTLNLILGGVSLLPGMPLDGGRVVRALSWARSGDPRRGSRVSALTGRATGWAMVTIGAVVVLVSGPAEGLMLMSLGWLVTTGARAVERRLALETLLEGVSVRDAIERDVPRVGPYLTLDTFAERFGARRQDPGATSIPVVADDRVLGVVAADAVRRLGRRRWATTRAADVMADPSVAPLLDGDGPLWEALETLRRSGVDGLPVVEDGVLEGVLTRRSAENLIRARLRSRAGAVP